MSNVESMLQRFKFAEGLVGWAGWMPAGNGGVGAIGVDFDDLSVCNLRSQFIEHPPGTRHCALASPLNFLALRAVDDLSVIWSSQMRKLRPRKVQIPAVSSCGAGFLTGACQGSLTALSSKSKFLGCL